MKRIHLFHDFKKYFHKNKIFSNIVSLHPSNCMIKEIALLPPILNKKCIDCRFFVPHNSINKDEIVQLGRCVKEKKICLITGEQQYEYANICRTIEQKCGINAKWFEESKIKDKIKWVQIIAYQPYYFILFGMTINTFILIKFLYSIF
jgi:hypothetical protein